MMTTFSVDSGHCGQIQGVSLANIIGQDTGCYTNSAHLGSAGRDLHRLHLPLAVLPVVVCDPGAASEHWLLTVPVTNLEIYLHTNKTCNIAKLCRYIDMISYRFEA